MVCLQHPRKTQKQFKWIIHVVTSIKERLFRKKVFGSSMSTFLEFPLRVTFDTLTQYSDWPNSAQYFIFVAPENARRPDVLWYFQGYTNGLLAWNGLDLSENWSTSSQGLYWGTFFVTGNFL